jgi:hypothetical protein
MIFLNVYHFMYTLVPLVKSRNIETYEIAMINAE